MIDFKIFIVPFIVIAVANFVLSWLYYSPLVPWFKTWQIGVGADIERKEMTEAEKKAMPRLMGGAVVASLLLSYGLQLIIHNINAKDFLSGAVVGLVLWFGFAVTHSLNTQFEGRKPIVLLINNGLYLMTYALFGGIVAIMI